MKLAAIQMILRAILSPVVFGVSFIGMSIFPGPMGLLMGVYLLIGRAIGVKDEFHTPIKDDLVFTFCWILLPLHYSRNFIVDGELGGD